MISSFFFRIVGSIHWVDLNLENGYGIYKAYSQSKLSNVLFTIELNNQLKDSNVTVVAVDPGLVNTEITRNYSGFFASVQKFLAPCNLRKVPVQNESRSLFLLPRDHVSEIVSNLFCYSCQTNNLKIKGYFFCDKKLTTLSTLFGIVQTKVLV